MAESQAPKTPRVEMIGTYKLEEPVRKVNPKNGLSYEVPRGEYPVMARLSSDGEQVRSAAVVFTAPSPNNGPRMDIVEMMRLVDIPAMVQRREIALEKNLDNSLKFPLSMFIDDEKKHTHVQAQASVPERRLSITRSA